MPAPISSYTLMWRSQLQCLEIQKLNPAGVVGSNEIVAFLCLSPTMRKMERIVMWWYWLIYRQDLYAKWFSTITVAKVASNLVNAMRKIRPSPKRYVLTDIRF
jgi:hypothetical protein